MVRSESLRDRVNAYAEAVWQQADEAAARRSWIESKTLRSAANGLFEVLGLPQRSTVLVRVDAVDPIGAVGAVNGEVEPRVDFVDSTAGVNSGQG